MHEVAQRRAVASDHGSLAAQQRADRSGNEPAPVPVAWAVHVAAARDTYRQAVRERERARNDVRQCLRRLVRLVHATDRMRFRVRKLDRTAIRLVTGRDYDSTQAVERATDIEESPRAADVRFERPDRIPPRTRNERLCAKMEDV